MFRKSFKYVGSWQSRQKPAASRQVIQDALAERFPEVPAEIYDELCGHPAPT